MLSGIMGSVVSGMAMGTGSAIAHRAVDSVMGPRQMEVVHKDAPAAAAGGIINTLWRFGDFLYLFQILTSDSFSKPTAPAANMDACKFEWSSVQECMKGAGNDTSACQYAMEMFNQCKRQSKFLFIS